MKILIATPIYPPEIGGPATYTVELVERLGDSHEITVVAYTDTRELPEKARLVRVSKMRPLPIRLYKFFSAVWKEAKKTDVIYVQNAVAAGLPVALVSVLRGKPFILKFVGDEAWERASTSKQTGKLLEEFLINPEGNLRIRLMRALQGWVLRRASIVTTPSVYLGEAIQKSYNLKSSKMLVNYNASEKTEVLPFETSRKPRQIATTARLVVWKGIDGIMKALKLVQKKYPDARLVVAGDGPELENLKKLRDELGLEDKVDFLGKISRSETWQLRKNSEIYVLNSTYEGLPHTVLTSFAAKIPTIATDIPGTNEAVYHEETGLLVKPGDTKALADAIERLLADKDLQKKLVENGSKLLKDKFSWEAHLKTLNATLESVALKPVD